MSVVILFSGGLDSSVMASMALEQGLEVFPLFVDYGQKSKNLELEACEKVLKQLSTEPLKIVSISDYSNMCPSGLTSESKDTFLDAFLPCRNLMFLLLGSAYAYEIGSGNVAIGFLSEETSIFPDQTKDFATKAENLLSLALGKEIKILTPLMDLTKADIVKLASKKGIRHTYSCHQGTSEPCGVCVACREFIGIKED